MEGDGAAPEPGAALELSLPPEQIARLLRTPALGGARWQSTALRFVWHDDAKGGLAARGLALQRAGTRWQLVRLLPDEGGWLPGRPAPVIAEDDEPARLGVESALPPLAHFEGRLRRRRLADATGTMLTVLDGTLRSINREQACCRVTLAGAPGRVAELAGALGRSLDIAIPPASLAAEAVALALGERPAPRRLGAPTLAEGLVVAEAVPRVIGQLTEVILYWASMVAAQADRETTEAVHQMRVALRRLRTGLSVFAPAIACPALSSLKAELKMLTSWLGPARDWDVFVTETGAAVTAALPQDAALAGLMQAADRRRQLHHAKLRRYIESAAFRRLGLSLAALTIAPPWQPSEDDAQRETLALPLAAHAADVLRRRSRRMIKRDTDLNLLPAAGLHAVRLEAKRLRYAAEFFAPLFPGRAMSRFLDRLAKLQAHLGKLNDGAVAADLMAELARWDPEGAVAEARGLVRGFVAASSHASRPKMLSSWKKFRKDQPF